MSDPKDETARPVAPDTASAYTVDRTRLERALHTVARIVGRPGGEIYLPIFERLERELAALDKAESTLARARALAQAVKPKRARSTPPAVPATDPRRI
jgi:hypothetical protein